MKFVRVTAEQFVKLMRDNAPANVPAPHPEVIRKLDGQCYVAVNCSAGFVVDYDMIGQFLWAKCLMSSDALVTVMGSAGVVKAVAAVPDYSMIMHSLYGDSRFTLHTQYTCFNNPQVEMLMFTKGMTNHPFVLGA